MTILDTIYNISKKKKEKKIQFINFGTKIKISNFKD